MQPEDLLVGLGETAAVFAGFGGIVAALGSHSVTELAPLERFRFENLLVISVFTCLLAFAPVVLGEFTEASSSVWAWSSAALALFALSFQISRARASYRIRALRARWGRPWMAALSVSVLAVIFVSQCANAIGWHADRSAQVYVGGIFGLLVLSGVQFVLLALDAKPSRRPEDIA
jgi:hypothetical protein